MRPAMRTMLLWLCLLPIAQSAGTPPSDAEWSAAGLDGWASDPAYWLGMLPDGDPALMPADAIAQRNIRILRAEPSMVYWPDWPATLSADAIRVRIQAVSKRPSGVWFKNAMQAVSEAEIDAWIDNMALDAVGASDDRLFGLVVERADLRRLPSRQRVFERGGSVDIDRLQESALFPGTPVAVLHESRDSQWLFVQSDDYAAWIRAEAVAIAPRAEVMRYADRQPRRIITGSQVRTVFQPDSAAVSETVLDMGSSFPLLADWPLSKPVNGQGSLGAWVVELPLRDATGVLHFKPALIPKSADTAPAPLPASRHSVIRQAFKFQGERYGWGHGYHGRDCSGFVSEVYRSMGIRMPRNTGDQQRSRSFERIAFDPELPTSQRIARLKALQAGDLVYIPGHVMLVVGHDRHGPWVIHDAHRTGMLVNGRFAELPMNSVAVTPLLAMAFSAERRYVDAVTAVQRILPESH